MLRTPSSPVPLFDVTDQRCRNWRFCAFGCVAVVVTTWWLFAPLLGAVLLESFDDGYMLRPPQLAAPWPDFLRWAFTTTYFGDYQPLSWLSFRWDGWIWGLGNSRGHHATNISLHAACAGLVFLLGHRWTVLRSAGSARMPVLLALSGAFLFALHPLRVEAVSWVSNRATGIP
jgi:hypothetical protein